MKASAMDPRRPEQDFVDIEDPKDVETWTRSLGISRQDLEQAVLTVGPSVGRVYDSLGRARSAPRVA